MLSSDSLMPKRTKKQKLQAEARREIELPFLSSQEIRQTSSVKTPPPVHYALNISNNNNPKSNMLVEQYAYVYHDLFKICIFTVIAIIFQSVLYFVLKGK